MSCRRYEAKAHDSDFSLRCESRVLDCLFQLRDPADRFSLKRGACRRQSCLPPIPFKEFDANLILQRLNLQTQSRLTEMHNFCGTTEVQCLSQRKKRTYVPEFHDSELIWFPYKSLQGIQFQKRCGHDD